MAAKHKQATRSNGGGRAPLPFWVWLLIGLLIGLGAAALVLFKGWAPKLREQAPLPALPGKPVAALPAATADKPKYDFYSVLPEMEVVVPEDELKAAPAAPADPAQGGAATRYVLQAGSFRNSADADALKARLILAGLRAQVQPVSVNGSNWYRVRIGPFNDLSALDAARNTLKGNGIDGIALRETQ